jgi:hypothetical protein
VPAPPAAGPAYDNVDVRFPDGEHAATPDEQNGAALRVEVFAADLDAFVDFYTRVLEFTLTTD